MVTEKEVGVPPPPTPVDRTIPLQNSTSGMIEILKDSSKVRFYCFWSIFNVGPKFRDDDLYRI